MKTDSKVDIYDNYVLVGCPSYDNGTGSLLI